MAAGDHLGVQFMYHHSSPENRESIGAHGLWPSNPFDPEIHEHEGMAPTGVYMGKYRSEIDQTAHGQDLWRVNATGLDTREDPDDPNHEYGFHYSANTIPPNRLKLVKKAVGDART